MGNSSSLTPIVASALAALIGGSVAYLVAVLSKEQKTSEFRQAWIDGLRADIADFVAGRTEIAFLLAAKYNFGFDHAEVLESFFKQFPELVSTEAKYHRIVLRINPAEHRKLLVALQRLNEIQPLVPDVEKTMSAAKAVTDEAQRVLKIEWDRVKKGETVYAWTKRVAVAVMIVALAVGAYELSSKSR